MGRLAAPPAVRFLLPQTLREGEERKTGRGRRTAQLEVLATLALQLWEATACDRPGMPPTLLITHTQILPPSPYEICPFLFMSTLSRA